MRTVNTLLLVLLALTLGWQMGFAQQSHRAALVVQFGDGSVVTACVDFTAENIDGAELLRRSGLSVVVDPHSGFGEAICMISSGGASNGCDYPAQECFCHCQGTHCVYWAYYHFQNGRWVYSEVGPSHWLVKDGDVEGWAWGSGAREGGSTNAEPPIMRFSDICGAVERDATPVLTVGGGGRILFYFGGFGLILVLILVAGAWALRRQSR
jgi:hypothetical protein